MISATPSPQVRRGTSRNSLPQQTKEPTPEGAGSLFTHEGERLTQTAMMPSFTKKYTRNAAMETQKRGFTSRAFPDVTFKMA